VNKDYLFTIVNTLDCKFFPQVEKEIENKLTARKQKDKVPAQIVIDPNMLELLR